MYEPLAAEKLNEDLVEDRFNRGCRPTLEKAIDLMALTLGENGHRGRLEITL